MTVERTNSGNYNGSGAALSGIRWAAAPSIGWIPTTTGERIRNHVSAAVSNDPSAEPPSQPEGLPSAAFVYDLGEASLCGEAGSMRQETMLGIVGLELEETPPLSTGMVNVTGEYNAYRMLPAGTLFNNDITVALPYDGALLPAGYRPEEITTYYYDVQYERWTAIKRDTVDGENKLVVLRVDHFTDFINTVIKTPEMPETQAYAPTMMSDIKVPNPLEGMPLVQPPSANNSRTANVTYPVNIPAEMLRSDTKNTQKISNIKGNVTTGENISVSGSYSGGDINVGNNVVGTSTVSGNTVYNGLSRDELSTMVEERFQHLKEKDGDIKDIFDENRKMTGLFLMNIEK